MQPFAGPGRRERSGSGRRPHGSVSEPRSEREPGGDIPGGDSPQGDRARGPLAGPRAPRRPGRAPSPAYLTLLTGAGSKYRSRSMTPMPFERLTSSISRMEK